MTFIHNIAIIPEPSSITSYKEVFSLNEKSIIILNKNLHKIGDFLKDLLLSSTGLNLEIKELSEISNKVNSISLILIEERDLLGSEGYILDIKPQNVTLSAKNPAGIFYGIQTFRQLLPVEVESQSLIGSIDWNLPCVRIEDFPRFSWRGYMLDEARHFHGKEIVKKLLDTMALLKLNIFHWHLTDDQGWRIEIKKYPNLINIGSKREETQVGNFLSNKTKKVPHSGYYSQEDIREIVEYAENRFITIIPEIDMPGHTRAAIASYPNISCRGYSLRVSPHWGIHRDILCIGKEEVFEFVQDVLNEIMELFPADMIHIGGDEAPTSRWRVCEYCQLRMKKEGITNLVNLQAYFTNRIATFLNSKGKRVIGWNEILSEDLKIDVICQYWFRGKEEVLNHLRKGGNAIISDFKYVYLDHSYSFTPLKLAYKFEPIPRKLHDQYHQNVLGLEALMWGEFIPTVKRLEWQTFPRLIAFSEVGWSQRGKRKFSSFLKRLKVFLKRFDLLGIKYANIKDIKQRFSKRRSGVFQIPQEENGEE